VFAEVSLDAVFAAEAAFELEEPIVGQYVPKFADGEKEREGSWDWGSNWVSGQSCEW
jgi:hypothetical protein